MNNTLILATHYRDRKCERNRSFHDLIDEKARVSDVRLAPASSVHGGANQGTYVCKEMV